MSNVVFVDASVDDAAAVTQQLVNQGQEAYLLDAQSDGVTQMAALLDGRSGIDAIHVIAPGSAGAMTLGSITLDSAGVASHAAELAAIGASLVEGGDLLVYGGHVGDGEAGGAFIQALADATQADVAASTDASGDDGGNWTLEASTGTIEADPVAAELGIATLDAEAGDGGGDDAGEDGGGEDGGGDVEEHEFDGGEDGDDLEGGDGDDVVNGFGGDDHFRGRHGNDHLIGGEGHDHVSYHDFLHGIHADLKHGQIDKGIDGTDTVEGIEDLQGSDYDDDLQGDDAGNHLQGENGADDIEGGAGDDDIDGGTGDDTADYRGAAAAVTASLATGHADDDGDGGSDTLTAIENLHGSTHADHLSGDAGGNDLEGDDGSDDLQGGAGDDALEGGNGSDRLDGGSGHDAMDGGSGNDTYVVDSSDDTVQESSALPDEIDTVLASVTFRLGDHLERLTLKGHGDVDGRGNSLANKLVGNDGDNALDGSGGADTMAGGDGNDTYVVDNAGDQVSESSADASQVDTVKASIKYTLGAHLENLLLSGHGAISGSGNELNNAITGNDAANTLKGGGGADKLGGGAGDDVLDGGIGRDVLTGGKGHDSFRFDSALNGKTNVDKILDFLAADDTLVLDNSVFTKIGANGALAKGAFHAGTAAHDSSDRVIYDADTGHLYYDADGSGSGAAVHFADVAAHTSLGASDFWIA